VIDARSNVLLSMNVAGKVLETVIRSLPALKKPTVSQLHGIDYYSIETVVPKKDVNILIPLLKDAGAEDILEIPISKIVR
jgi:ATP phosphoribosyltransferase